MSSTAIYYAAHRQAPYLIQRDDNTGGGGREDHFPVQEADAAAGMGSSPTKNATIFSTGPTTPTSSSAGGAATHTPGGGGGAGSVASSVVASSTPVSRLVDHSSPLPRVQQSSFANVPASQQSPLSQLPSWQRRQLHADYPAVSGANSWEGLQIQEKSSSTAPDWRLRDRMKTVGVGLILCLNVGTDPPDVVKPHPCAVLQCWMNPLTVSRAKAREMIGERLEQQYARWQLARITATRPQLRHRRTIDPTVEDVRTLCLGLRKQARQERVLLHYNGHGVPRPTDHGEIWVFDKNHTEYIPLPVTDLRQWIGKPSIVVLDCSSAGILLPFFTKPLNPDAPLLQPQYNNETDPSGDDDTSQWINDTIVLCACDAGEVLPMDPDYPADIFTSCLTTPISMALQWFVRRNPTMDLEPIDDWTAFIPGAAGDRKTPLGELNWIFTAVTDSIAWNVLPRYLFQRLFRQDLLVASLFRNFLLADRVLRHLGCTPVSYPALPSTADHPLWQAWDLALETMLFQLIKEGIIPKPQPRPEATEDPTSLQPIPPSSTAAVTSTAISSPFFSEQLTAFEVWLDFAAIHKIHLANGILTQPPEQLPVVLQVLLSQVHRVRALMLLRNFLDLGPWAVNLSLSLGIFPYVMKLLQSPEYKSLLVAIWASILMFDPSCRVDLLKDGAIHHFVQHLMWGLKNSNIMDVSGAAKERALAAFILSICCHEYPAGQAECARLNLHGNCCALLSSYEQGEKTGSGSELELHLPAYFRLWLVLCLASMVVGNRPIQVDAYSIGVHQHLALRLQDRDTHVRAAVCYAMGCLIGTATAKSRSASQQELSKAMSPPVQKSSQSLISTAAGLLAGPHLVPTIAMPEVLSGSSGLHPAFAVPSVMHAISLGPQQQPGLQPMANIGQAAPGAFFGQPPSIRPNIPTQYLMPIHHHAVPQGSPASFLPALIDPSGSSVPKLSEQLPAGPPNQQAPLSVFEDRKQLDLDLFCLEHLVQAMKDGSVLVRYEAVVGFGAAVGKYLEAFVVIAGEAVSSEHNQADPDRLFGLDHHTMRRFRMAWTALRMMQKEESFPSICKASNDIVKVVHENLLKFRAEHNQKRRGSDGGALRSAHRRSSLAGIDENAENTSGEAQFDQNGDIQWPSQRGVTELRRVSSDIVTLSVAGTSNVGDSSSETQSNAGKPEKPVLDAMMSSYTLPKSEFFRWKTSSFDHNFHSSQNDREFDPLSPEGARKLFQDRRDNTAKELGREFGRRYEVLAPKPPKPTKKGIDLILEEEAEQVNLAADEDSALKKRELELREALMIRNDGAKMTSMLLFHPFDDFLVSCDGSDMIASWDSETGRKVASVKNGNPDGTRMTTCCWINESSASLFLVGSDEGTVRLWSGLVGNPGVESGPPSLVSSFQALPMIEGQRHSGLVCEWQRGSGRLVASGSSKYLRSWDVESEQVALEIETNTDAHVTTLTTAWDNDQGLSAQATSGISPDVVVAGLSDGALRVFDIRSNRASLDMQSQGSRSSRRHSPRATQYSEHKSWVVATAFTSYANKHEIVSGTLSGEIKAWDLRMSTSIRTIEAQRRIMTTLAVHSKIPIMASGSHAQFIKILTLDGDILQVLRYHEKMQNHRIGPVSYVTFHPFKPLLAAGATDSCIGLYAPKKKII